MKQIELRSKQLVMLLSFTTLGACADLQKILPSKSAAPASAPATSSTAGSAPAAPTPSATAPSTTPAVPAVSSAQQVYNDSSELYDKGEFSAAIKKLSGSNEIWTADKALQLKALKIMAFAYCVTGRSSLGRQQFEKALRLDPTFTLEPGERNHPLWGPVFDQAQKVVANEARKSSKKTDSKR